MKSLNQCNFIGNLGKEPESRTTPGGATVSNFSIAVSDDYTKDGQKVEATEWVRVVVFGKLAEICGEYLTKGSKVFVTGRFKTRSWEQDGVKRYTTEIVASEMQMLDSRENSQAGGAQTRPDPAQGHRPAQQAPSNFDNFDDDIPW